MRVTEKIRCANVERSRYLLLEIVPIRPSFTDLISDLLENGVHNIKNKRKYMRVSLLHCGRVESKMATGDPLSLPSPVRLKCELYFIITSMGQKEF